MFGQNPIRPPEKGDGSLLQVQEIFYTFQGEGPFAGYPSVFIRLGGCNLACSFCDTEFESFAEWQLPDLMAEVKKLRSMANLVVITGGEPFRQPIEKLCEALIAEGFTVQIETNGTIYRLVPEGVHIICSPKSSHGRYYPVREDLLQKISAFKFIISVTMSGYQEVAEVGQGLYGTPVYVQPMDEGDEEKNRGNLAYTTELVLKNGYRLSLQLHKIAGVRYESSKKAKKGEKSC